MSKPIHPGKVLLNDFLIPLKITQYQLSAESGVCKQAINQIILGRRGISIEKGLTLAAYFETQEDFFILLQTRYDIEIEKSKPCRAKILRNRKP